MGSPETCPACSHPPHLGACSRRMGGTAYSCGCLRQTPTPPAPADDASGAEAMMPKDVPGAAEFRDAFKAAVPPRGADHASWVNGYCAGWIACEKAFPLPARDDAVEEARRAFHKAAHSYCAACVDTARAGGPMQHEAASKAERSACSGMHRAYADYRAALRRAKGGA